MTVFDSLLARLDRQSANYLLLIDPDSKNDHRWEAMVDAGNAAGIDAFLVGGSLIMDDGFDRRVEAIKGRASAPVILFPGASSQLSRHADAILFLTLLSGRNPQYLIGEQVQAAPVVKHMGLESIPTGYLLMDGGSPTAVEFISATRPLPMHKPDIVVAHALAAQYMGMAVVYLEAGSGAAKSVPDEVISVVTGQLDIPVIAGGGIREPQQATAKVKAGARFIVTGTVAERDDPGGTLQAFADAIHGA
jgi:putative glycerol-1-phosphate prenyltransferase